MLSPLTLVANAQLGEEAGPFNFQVQIGHNQTIQLHLLNSGNTSINVQISAENLTKMDNQTTPTITMSPAVAVIGPRSQLAVNVTVYMPLADTPGAVTWTTIISAIEMSNVSNPGGAVLEAGVAKITSISAIPSTTSTTSTSTSSTATTSTVVGQAGAARPVSLSAIWVVAVAVIVIITAVAVYASRERQRRRTRKRKRAAARRKARRRRKKPVKKHRKRRRARRRR